MARKEVKLKIRLDGKAEFKAELDKLIKESGANNLKFDTSSAIKSLNEFSKILDDVGKKIQGSFNATKINNEVQAINKATEAQRKYNSVKSDNPKTESVTIVSKEGEGEIQRITKINNGLGQTVKLTQDLINNTTTTSDTTNYKKQSDSIDKMNERVLKLIQSMNLMKDTNLFDKSVFNNNKGNGYLDELKGLDKNINVSNIDKATASVEKLEQKSKDMSPNSKRIVEITKSFETLKDLKLSDNFAKLDETQIKQYNDQLKNTTDLLKKLKGNSGSVNDISYSQGLSGLKDTTKDLSSSIKEIDKYGETIDKLKSKMQGGVTKLGANSFLDDSVITDLQNRLNSINTNSSEEEIKQLEQEIKNLGSSDSQIVRVQSSLSKMKSNLEGMKGKYQGLVGDKDSIAQLEKYNSEIKKLEGLLRDLQSGKTFTGTKISSELNEASEASRNLTNAVKNSSSALKLSQQDAQSFGNSIKRAFANAGMYTSVYEVIQLTARALREGIKTVIGMDSALADLNKVVNLTKTQLDEMKNSAVAMGKEFGKSAIEVSNAQAEFGKAYKDTNDINTLTKTSLLGANVMDGTTSAEVAKSLTTIITSMKKEVGDSMTILDSMNEIQNNFRISADDMSQALAQVGSTAYTSGAELEKVEGYITAMSVSTGRSGDEVGNSLRSIMARIYKIGLEGQESAGKPEKQLNDIGVAVRDSEGNFRKFGDVMDDLSKKWGTLSTTSKIATSQQVAGIQQYNQFMAMMNNYQMSIDATTTALNSQGSATKENEIYMQSAQAKIEQLKVSLQEMALNFINSDTVKVGIDALRGLVEMFDNLPLVISVATTALMLFKGQAIMGSIASVVELGISLGATSVGAGFFTGAINKATISVKRFGVALASNPLGLLALAITAIIGGLSHLDNKAEEAKESLKNMASSLSEGISNYKDSDKANKDLSDLIEQQEKLDNQIKNSRGTNEELTKAKSDLLEVERKIAGILPDSVTGYDSENKKLSENIELNKLLLEQKKAQAEADLRKTVNDTDKEVVNSEDLYNQAKSRLESSEVEKQQNYKNIDDIKNSDLSDEAKNKQIEEETNNIISLSKAQNEEKMIMSQAIAGRLQANLVYEQFNKTIGSVTGEHRDLLDMTKYTMEGINNETDATKKSTQALDENIKKTQEAIAKKYDSSEASKNYKESLDQQQKIVDLQNQINESGKLTPSIVQSALDLYPEMGSAVFDVATLQEYLNNKVSEQEDKQRQAYVNMMQGDEAFFSSKIKNTSDYEKFTATVLSNLSNLNIQYFDNNADGMKTELDNAKNLGQARTAIEAKVVEANMRMWSEYYSKLAMTTAKATDGSTLYENPYDSYGHVKKGYEGIVAQQSQQLQMINAMRRASDDLGRGIDIKMPTFSSTDFKNSGKGDSSSSTKKEVEDMKDLRDRYYELQNAIDVLADKQTYLNTVMENSTGQEKLKYMQQQIDLYKQQQQAISNMATAVRDERWELQRDLGNNWGFTFGGQGEVTNYQTRLKQLTDYANSLTGDTKENQIKAIEEVADKLKNYTDLTVNKTNEMSNEWYDLSNKIKDAYKTMADDIATEEKNISDIIKYYAEKNVKEKQDAIDRQIEATNKMYDQEDKEVALSKKKTELAELKSEMDKFQFATDKIGVNKFKALQEQYKTLEEEMNNTIRDNQKQATIDAMQKEKDDLSTALEDYLKPENINKLIEAGLKTGMVDIMGQVVDLNNANSQMLKETEIGYTNIASKTKEWKDYLSSIIAMYPQLGNITSNLGYTIDRTAPINLGTGSLNVANLTNSVGSGGINISMPLTINGNVDDTNLSNIQSMIDTATSNVKKEINKSLGNR